MNIFLVLHVLALLASNQTPVFTQATAHEVIYAYEVQYAIPNDELYATLKCESELDPGAINLHDSHGGSYGIAQINRGSHTDITKKQMLDPIFSISWAAQQFAADREEMWSCYNNIYGSEAS